MTEQTTFEQKLLLSARDASKALSICERTLWGMTKRGEILCVRCGCRVLYDPRDLVAFIDARKGCNNDAD